MSRGLRMSRVSSSDAVVLISSTSRSMSSEVSPAPSWLSVKKGSTQVTSSASTLNQFLEPCLKFTSNHDHCGQCRDTNGAIKKDPTGNLKKSKKHYVFIDYTKGKTK